MRQNAGFFYSTCFEHQYAHRQEYISEYRFLVCKTVSRRGCGAQGCKFCVRLGGSAPTATHTTNSPALHNSDGLQFWTPESGSH
jgi:hypothetical protein